jgi:hypothetical protein
MKNEFGRMDEYINELAEHVQNNNKALVTILLAAAYPN